MLVKRASEYAPTLGASVASKVERVDRVAAVHQALSDVAVPATMFSVAVHDDDGGNRVAVRSPRPLEELKAIAGLKGSLALPHHRFIPDLFD